MKTASPYRAARGGNDPGQDLAGLEVSYVAAICAGVLMGLELLVIAAGTAWAIGGLLDVAPAMEIGLYAAFGLPALILSLAFARRALAVEAAFAEEATHSSAPVPDPKS